MRISCLLSTLLAGLVGVSGVAVGATAVRVPVNEDCWFGAQPGLDGCFSSSYVRGDRARSRLALALQ